jgi:hypothetical protein
VHCITRVDRVGWQEVISYVIRHMPRWFSPVSSRFVWASATAATHRSRAAP